MGAASSVIREGTTINEKYLDLNGTIYKQLKCGCIYCSHYEHLQPYDIELALPCYDCFEGLREKDYEKFNKTNVQNMFDILKTYEMEDLLTERMGWLTEEEAIQYANTKRISIIELTNSSYILNKFGIEIY
jgi:hypothetical protein